MVGVVIGLLAILVIAQVALVYEGQKRSTTSGSDAQVNGALAMQTLQRDVQMSGYGPTSALTTLGGSGCTIRAIFNGAAAADAPGRLAPVVIDDGGDGGLPDTLRVLSSGNSNFSVPIALGADHGPTDTYFTLKQGSPQGAGFGPGVNIGNSQGDLMLAVNDEPPNAPRCTLFSINVDGMVPTVRDPATGEETEGAALGTVAAGTQLVEVAAAPTGTVSVGRRIGHTSDARWNSATPLIPDTYKADFSYLVNLGQPANLIYRSYGVNANGLVLTTFDASTGAATSQDLYSGIVNLQAVYLKAKGNLNQQVDAWEPSNPASDATLVDASSKSWPGWTRVYAVRIAVVARSQQFEKSEVTAVQPTWRPNGVDTVTLKVDGNADWKHYRYKVYETVVPLRNLLWQS